MNANGESQNRIPLDGYPGLPPSFELLSSTFSRWDPKSETVLMLLKENKNERERLRRKIEAEEKLEALKLERARKVEQGMANAISQSLVSVTDLEQQHKNNSQQRERLFNQNSQERELLRNGFGVDEILERRDRRLQEEKDHSQKMRYSQPSSIGPPSPPNYLQQHAGTLQLPSTPGTPGAPGTPSMQHQILPPTPPLSDIKPQHRASNGISSGHFTVTKAPESGVSEEGFGCKNCSVLFSTERQLEKHVCYGLEVHEPVSESENATQDQRAESVTANHDIEQGFESNILKPPSSDDFDIEEFVNQSFNICEEREAVEMHHCCVCNRGFALEDFGGLFKHECERTETAQAPFQIFDIPEHWKSQISGGFI